MPEIPTTTIPDPSTSPAGRLQRNPGGVLSSWATRAWEMVGPWLVPLGIAAAGLGLVAIVVRGLVHRRRVVALARGARLVTVQSPPEVEVAGAATLWANLVELLRPPWRRLLEGQPHLAFELAWSEAGLRVGIWVPGPVPPGLVERAVEAAWPGAATTVTVVEPPLPLDAVAAGGELRLAVAEWFPLRTDHDVDPLRSLLGAAGGLGRARRQPCRSWPAP